VHVVFLDANVLFSAAYRAESRLREFWTLAETQLVTSAYALEEAKRNLHGIDQLRRLKELAAGVRVVNETGAWALPPDVLLPEKDRPILSAAILCGATHLVTGDQTHFGVWYGQRVGGVLILRPAAYLASRAAETTAA
jgi:predicted nucleic acid-binding protein